MGQLAQTIHDEAAARIPAAPVTKPADLLTGPELLAIFAQVEQAVAELELRAAGSEIRSGSGQPSNNDGNDLDLYVDKANGDLWAKDAAVWNLLLNLRGPKGLQGTKGATGDQGDPGLKGNNGKDGANGRNGNNGMDGRDGNRITAPPAAPAASDGQEGDLAIVATTGDLQEKTASGWVTRGNLKGPKGDAGTGGSSSGGTGTVKSVNGVGPDANGNVTVAAGGAAVSPVQALGAGNSSDIPSTAAVLETTGQKAQLATTDKSNLVAAINEVAGRPAGGTGTVKSVSIGTNPAVMPDPVTKNVVLPLTEIKYFEGFTSNEITDLENDAYWNNATNQYTGPALTTTVRAIHERYASAAKRGALYSTNGSGFVNRYLGS